MLEIKAFDIVGEFAISPDCGQALYDQIHPLMESRTPVVVDFAGVTIVTAPFLRSAIGQLAQDFANEDVRRRLEIENLSPANMVLLTRVMAHACRYHTDGSYSRAGEAGLGVLRLNTKKY